MRGTLLPVLFLLLSCGSNALFEDQSGSFDWYQQHVGPVRGAQLSSTKPRVIVRTISNVLGSLNLRDGSITWRKLLQEKLLHVVMADDLVLGVSDGKIRAFDQNLGGLKWEADGPRASSKPSISVRHGEFPSIAVATWQTIQVIDGQTGEFVTTKSLEGLNEGDHVLASNTETQNAVYSYSPGSSELKVMTLSSSGLLEQKLVVSPSPLDVSTLTAGPAGFAAISSDLSSFCSFNEESSGGSVVCTPLDTLSVPIPSPATGTVIRLLGTSFGWIFHSKQEAASSGSVSLVSTAASLSPVLLKTLGSAAAVSAPVISSEGEVVVVASSESSGSIKFQVISTATGEEVFVDTVTADSAAPSGKTKGSSATKSIQEVFLGSYKRKGQPDGFRSVVVWEDESVSLLQQGRMVWTREEALGAVVSTMFVELPASTNKAGQTSSVLAATPAPAQTFDLKRFIKMQTLSVKVQFKINTPEEGVELKQMRSQASDRALPYRDLSGFRKLILLLSQTGSLTALHNGDGHVVWSKQYKASQAPQQLLPWRTFHDLTHAPQVLALRQGGESGESYASIVDAHSSVEVDRMILWNFEKVLPVHTIEQHDQHSDQEVYLLVTTSPGSMPTVRLLPDTPKTRTWFSDNYHSLYFWLQDSSSNSLSGFGFDLKAAESIAATGAAAASQLWRFAPPQSILGMATRDHKEVVQTSVKVLGDRSIKYKYLNPNTLLLVLGDSPYAPAASDAGSSTQKKGTAAAAYDKSRSMAGHVPLPELIFIVLDTATGRVMHSQAQVGASGPVRLLFSENVAIVEFWDSIAKRMGVISMDLFDATPREFSVLDYLFNPNSTQPVSSFDGAPLEVLSMPFWSHVPSAFLSVTRTREGITSRQLLVGSVTDQVFTMDMRFLDPRRPRHQKLTPQEQEERLIPYAENLPFNPLGYATYDKQVLGLSHIEVEPSRLESTCLMLARGVDLFYTRLAPARKYDSLEDDFSYGLLIVAILALLTGSLAMHFITKKSMLSQKWA